MLCAAAQTHQTSFCFPVLLSLWGRFHVCSLSGGGEELLCAELAIVRHDTARSLAAWDSGEQQNTQQTWWRCDCYSVMSQANAGLTTRCAEAHTYGRTSAGGPLSAELRKRQTARWDQPSAGYGRVFYYSAVIHTPLVVAATHVLGLPYMATTGMRS